MTDMNDRTVTYGMLLLFVSLMVLAACESQGAKLFWNNRCKECHTIDGKGGSSGPNLTNVGGKRTREYIVQQIKDPKSHNPNSDMPSFRNALSEQDINALADYLSGLN
jgi:mono/diheme cytochrome c family protein